MNNVVIASGEHQKDPAIYTYPQDPNPSHACNPFSPKQPSYPGCHIALSRAPRAIH